MVVEYLSFSLYGSLNVGQSKKDWANPESLAQKWSGVDKVTVPVSYSRSLMAVVF